MRNIRWYESAVRADQAAAFLRRHGILAGAVHHNIDFSGGMVAKFSGSGHGVSVIAKEQEAVARELLNEFEALPEDADDDLWEADSVPDLTRLDPAMLPACPSCGETLPADATLERCPACGAEVDVAGLVAAKHGPEALAACYDEPEPVEELDADLIARTAIDCPNCSYALEGVGMRGRCPECGEGFDKEDIVRRMLGFGPLGT